MPRKNVFAIGCFVLFATLLGTGTTLAQIADPPVGATDSNKASVAPLIDVAQLKSMLAERASIRLIDVGTEQRDYAQRHIPGAQFVHWIDDIIDARKPERYNLIDAVKMQSLLRRLGIANEDHIVLYDNFSSRLATRFYWSLKVYNHRNVSVLNGGLLAWTNQGGALSRQMPTTTPSDYQVKQANPAFAVDMDFVKRSLGNPKVTLIDGRPAEQFSGEAPGKVFHTGKAHKLSGHIPGAVHVFWKDNFNEDGTFKSIDALRSLYKKAGVETVADQTVVTYCNEGLHAAPPWFVLRELLGVSDVRVYDDSMSEWGNSDQPVHKGSAAK